MVEHHLYTNRLIQQKSPYLQQHAHNPVDWYPWGAEAFKAARDKDKPIFLSIGYATCHWCHVMETESFENVEVAQLLNENFINIKVDREELPEVDNLYMEFAQSMMAGAAGWPLNIILTPELQPFFAATYLPPKHSHGLMGLEDLVHRIKEIWAGEEREKIIEQAEHIVEAFAEHIHVRGDIVPKLEQIEDGAELLFKMSDPVSGGIRGMPKFPVAYQWGFLLNYYLVGKDSRAIFLVERTLDMMQRGGIYDHLGGGFSRYSVDDRWLVPHFEKMLYDNALLASVYLGAWQLTKFAFYRSTCEEILSYVLRDMTHPEGGFFSAEDADSEGHEGYFYTWAYDEVLQLLGEEAPLFCEFYGVTREGNFEGRNILHIDTRLAEFAVHIGREPDELAHQFEKQRQILWKARESREHPFKDDKVLSSWNGLMIHSLAAAGIAFGYKSYSNAALRAAQFIRTHMWQDGHLMRRWRDGEALHKAGMDEYAFLIRGLITLFETGNGSQWLEWAVFMMGILKEQFKVDGGAFYQTDGHDENIILRKCQFSDGAEPSGNAIHCENLLRLYRFTGENDYLHQAEDIFKAVKKFIDNYSPGYCYHLSNLIRYYRLGAATVVIALNEAEEHKGELGQLLFQRFLPFHSIVWRYHGDERLWKLIPFTETQVPISGQTTLYICQHGACSQPITQFHEMIEAIDAL